MTTKAMRRADRIIGQAAGDISEATRALLALGVEPEAVAGLAGPLIDGKLEPVVAELGRIAAAVEALRVLELDLDAIVGQVASLIATASERRETRPKRVCSFCGTPIRG